MQGIISPNTILEKNIVTAAPGHADINTWGPQNQVQQVGIDLRLWKVYELRGPLQLMLDETKSVRPSLQEAPLHDNETFFLTSGNQYFIEFMEDVEIPADMAALVVHRSTINRFAGTVLSGWYDPGFKSRGGCGAIFRPLKDLKIQRGYRVAQIVFFSAESANLYNGQYQAK